MSVDTSEPVLETIAEAIDEAQALWTKIRDVDAMIDELIDERDEARDDARAAMAERDEYEREAGVAYELLENVAAEVRALLEDVERGIWSLDEVADKVTDLTNVNQLR